MVVGAPLGKISKNYYIMYLEWVNSMICKIYQQAWVLFFFLISLDSSFPQCFTSESCKKSYNFLIFPCKLLFPQNTIPFNFSVPRSLLLSPACQNLLNL